MRLSGVGKMAIAKHIANIKKNTKKIKFSSNKISFGMKSIDAWSDFILNDWIQYKSNTPVNDMESKIGEKNNNRPNPVREKKHKVGCEISIFNWQN